MNPLKYLILFISTASLLFGGALEDKIQNLIGDRFYLTNRNFIDRVFSNPNSFYDQQGNLQVRKVLQTLKANGLLPLKFKQPGTLRVSFEAQSSPLLLLKTIQSVLSLMGYSYVMVLEMERKQDWSKATFGFSTEYALDPTLLGELFAKKGFEFSDVKRDDLQNWHYAFQVRTPKLANATTIIPTGHFRALKEISGEYWLDMAYSGKLSIIANPDWQPQISFFDSSLQMRDFIYEKNPTSKISISIPDGVRFVKISDMQNPIVLKGGIKVLLESSKH
ncbi:hypothetical protein [Helicobacter bizzozeronii]|uniref:hypothetical protein n=1 Tax=Helicobacter bizzozeronii TaxID=56877 RepID=UPI000CF0356A|nr:hypothetical protein [Helicobacter bizzozeronii]